MVDVSAKDVTARTARATGRVLVSPRVVELLRGEGVPKGDALATARIAGIMGAKRTPDLIPLCHPLAVSGVTVDLAVTDDAVEITATVQTTDRTGVEMEALTAVSRRRPHRRRHGQGRRQGGGHHRRPRRGEDRRQVRRLAPVMSAAERSTERPCTSLHGPRTAALAVTASNRAAAGVYEDRGGPLIVDALAASAGLRGRRAAGGARRRAGRARRCATRSPPGYDVVLTTGGTGHLAHRPHPRGHPRACWTTRSPASPRRSAPPAGRRCRPPRCPAASRASPAAPWSSTSPARPAASGTAWPCSPRCSSHAVDQIRGGDHRPVLGPPSWETELNASWPVRAGRTVTSPSAR